MEFVGPYLTYIFAALIVLVALLIFMLVWRALRGTISGRRGSRLGVSEFHEVDKTRRLVLIRRDGVEHLVMIGGPQDVVIETGIDVADGSVAFRHSQTPGAERSEPAFTTIEEEDEAPRTPRPAPRPAVFGDRAPLRAVEPGRLFRENQDD